MPRIAVEGLPDHDHILVDSLEFYVHGSDENFNLEDDYLWRVDADNKVFTRVNGRKMYLIDLLFPLPEGYMALQSHGIHDFRSQSIVIEKTRNGTDLLNEKNPDYVPDPMYKGVIQTFPRIPTTPKWKAYAFRDGEEVSLGTHRTAWDAAWAHDQYITNNRLDKRHLNFPNHSFNQRPGY